MDSGSNDGAQEPVTDRVVRPGAGPDFVRFIAALGQTADSAPLTWDQVRDRLRTANPSLLAAQLNIEESRVCEVTAFLRPNPFLTGTLDQINPFELVPSPVSCESVYRPLANVFPSGSVSYLHEREHKRELRLEAARHTTDISASAREDQERNLLFTLRTAFVETPHSRAVLDNARENLAYWDRDIDVNRQRMDVGDIAAVDLDRLLLQRVQFESDVETAVVGLRTAKIQMLTAQRPHPGRPFRCLRSIRVLRKSYGAG